MILFEIIELFSIGTVSALNVGRPNRGSRKKGPDTMFAIFEPNRTTATTLAAAFLSAMLLVSTATSIVA